MDAYYETRETLTELLKQLEKEGKTVEASSTKWPEHPHMIIYTIKNAKGKIERQICHVTADKHTRQIKTGLRYDR